MVVDGVAEEAEAGTDRLFQALADLTRRDILRRCGRDELSVSRLAEAYPMSFAAVQKHVAVLERAGLVVKERRGREQLVRTDPDALDRARRALDELEGAWRGRVARMSELLAEAPEAGSESPSEFPAESPSESEPETTHQPTEGQSR
ncbi:ArsR/SmtB family transcription factor [Streptomyces sp. enrichment culture]|uniref:ArsR/SmtB family transcription factor n=1 Tax=Streptomyces sp. enrichment culture TaxID=1795815 RepID=UPI003F57E038